MKPKTFKDKDGFKCHVIDIFTHEGQDYITYKILGKKRVCWFFYTHTLSSLRMAARVGLIGKEKWMDDKPTKVLP